MTTSVFVTRCSKEQKKYVFIIFFPYVLFPSVPWSKQQTLTVGGRRGMWGKDCFLPKGSCNHANIEVHWHYTRMNSYKNIFFIVLILVIIGFISIALFLIYIHNTAFKLFGSIKYYRMLRKMEELQYTKESTVYDLPLPSPREKYQETVLWWQMFNNWFPNKEAQICWAHPYPWFKSSHCDWC